MVYLNNFSFALSPYFTEKEDSFAERMIVTAPFPRQMNVLWIKSRINQALNRRLQTESIAHYAKKWKILKNEGGLNNHDAYASGRQ